MKSFCEVESHALYLIIQAFIFVFFWYGVWTLLDEAATWLQERYGISRKQYALLNIAVVVLFILLFPKSLSNF